MLLETERNTLLEPLLKTAGFVERKQTMPILSNVYLKKTGDSLTVIANDLEIQASITNSNPMSGEDFTITLPGKKLQDILKTFPDTSKIKLEQQESRILVKSGRAKFTIQSMSADHYPLIKIQGDNLCQFSLEQAKFKKLISKIQYAMADKDTRVFLNGMLLEIKNNQLRLAATDAHRLGFASLELEQKVADCSIIIPRKTILELSRFLEDSDAPVTISIYPNQLMFEATNKQLITKIIEGKYPDYERVIPLNNEKICIINREILLKAVDRVAVIGFDKLKTITFELSNNHLLISCNNENQEESRDEIEVVYPGEDTLKLNFNISYIRELLTHSQADELQWAFFDNQRSVLVTVPNELDFKAVLMPLRH